MQSPGPMEVSGFTKGPGPAEVVCRSHILFWTPPASHASTMPHLSFVVAQGLGPGKGLWDEHPALPYPGSSCPSIPGTDLPFSLPAGHGAEGCPGAGQGRDTEGAFPAREAQEALTCQGAKVTLEPLDYRGLKC